MAEGHAELAEARGQTGGAREAGVSQRDVGSVEVDRGWAQVAVGEPLLRGRHERLRYAIQDPQRAARVERPLLDPLTQRLSGRALEDDDLLAMRPNERTDIRGGVTKYTALAIKAIANLELENYQEVADATGEIISSGRFMLEPDYYELFKIPGKLNAEEWEQMKLHPVIGAETLREVDRQHPGNSFIKTGIAIAEGHHEKWDGSGYPHGKEGEDIPLVARVLALGDVYDALTSKRCYKEAFSHDKSVSIILEGDGNHFDPDIVLAFRETEMEFMNIRNNFEDSE